jgi:hypothetical protein
MRWPVLWGALLVASCLGRQARAQDDGAEVLTKQGLELRRQRRDAEALDAFRRAYAIKATPRTLAQIALAEQALGKWVDAEADLDAALRSTDDAWIAPHRDTLLGGLATIRSHLGWLEVTADAPAARVWVNGAELGELPLAKPVRVEAGSVVVEVRAAGFVPARRVPFVEPGGSAREAVHLVPLAPEPPAVSREATEPPASGPQGTTEPPRAPPSIASQSNKRAPRTAGDARARYAAYVALGAGAVGLGLGTYFGILTLEKRDERDQVCPALCPPSTNGYEPPGVVLDQRARALAMQSTAWFVGGALAATTGAVLMWIARPRSVDSHGATLRIVPQLGANRAGASLGVGGSW